MKCVVPVHNSVTFDTDTTRPHCGMCRRRDTNSIKVPKVRSRGVHLFTVVAQSQLSTMKDAVVKQISTVVASAAGFLEKKYHTILFMLSMVYERSLQGM